VADKIEPLDLLHVDRAFHLLDDETGPLVRPLQAQVKAEGLWAAHQGPELGGKGFGQLKLALINEILGTSRWAPIVFGTAAPDTGNAEIIAHYGTDAQKAQYLQPLLDGECFSCYSMTEPHAGSDPKMFTTRAVKDRTGGASRRARSTVPRPSVGDSAAAASETWDAACGVADPISVLTDC
jgi:acyl-CoA dehydrogenase